MFGYVRPFKPEMKMKDYETYRGIYCGLCKQLGKSFGPFSRLTLNYDFTFLAAVYLSVHEDCPSFSPKRCFLHPLMKRPCCKSNVGLVFAANAAMIMLYYKFVDDLADSGFWKRALLRLLQPFVAHARKKAKQKYPEFDRIAQSMSASQTSLEKQNCPVVDEAAEPTAKALSEYFAQISGDEKTKRILARMGYFIGRFVYLADAVDDLEEDRKNGCYNPFLAADPTLENRDSLVNSAIGSLNLTLGEIANAYQLLNLTRFDAILENIIYFGLPNVVQSLKQGKPKGSLKNGRKEEPYSSVL